MPCPKYNTFISNESPCLPAENGLDALLQLLLWVTWELLVVLVKDLLVLSTEHLEMIDAKIDVVLHTGVFLDFVEALLEVLVGDALDDIAKHVEKTAVRVVGKARVLRRTGQSFDSVIVEADIQDRVHHSRHTDGSSRADGEEKRILGVAESLAGISLDAFDVASHVVPDFLRQILVVFGQDLAQRRWHRKACMQKVSEGMQLDERNCF